jgi:hypothetical protein
MLPKWIKVNQVEKTAAISVYKRLSYDIESGKERSGNKFCDYVYNRAD